jgi:HJR/Mrr/RecB family endonuclease
MDVLDYSEDLLEVYGLNDSGEISFYPRDDRCPFCARATHKAFSTGIIEYDPEERDTRKDIHHLVVASSCECGWWSILHDETPDAHNLYSPPTSRTHIRAVLRRFDVMDQRLSVEALRTEIKRRPQVLDAIGPRKMEELASSVMGDFFPGCKSKICGKSGDGGIDLLLVMADKPFAVQVKHRQRVDKAEPVNAVREFIGAMLLEDMAHGIYVTTAEHFSPASQNAASKILRNGKVQEFKLIDRRSFLEMIAATARQVSQPWLQYIPPWLQTTTDRLTPFSVKICRQ